MPIYEYYCDKCKQVFELKRPMSEMSDPAQCPKCDNSGHRLISVFGATNGIRQAGGQDSLQGRFGAEIGLIKENLTV